MTAFWWSVMRCRDKLHILSERIGLRLYAIAEDPICVDSNGSSSSYRLMIYLNPEFHSRFPYLEVGQQSDVSRDLMCRRAKTRQRRQDVNVDLARVRLGCDGVSVLKPTQFCDAFVQCLYFCVVAIEEGQETGLGTRRSFRTTEADVVSCPFEVPKIPKKFLSMHTSTHLSAYMRYRGESKPGSRV